MDLMEESIPKSWRRAALGDIAEVERGKFTHRPRNDPRFYGGGIPFVQTGDVANSQGRIRTYSQTLNELGLSVSKTFPAGVILITIAANIGFTGILEFESACPDSLVGIIPRDGVDAHFLHFFLVTQQPEMDRLAPKGTQKNINLQFLRPWPIVLPPLSEQRRIAGVLGLVQRAVEQQERLLALVAELKQTLLHHLFTHGLRGEPQKPTDLGPIPQSWELRSCDELCEMISVGVVVRPASHYVPTGVPAFRSFNVREDRLNPSDLVYFSEETNNTKLVKSKLRKGDVLVVRTGYPGTSCVVPDEYDGANCIDLVIVRPKGALVRSGFLSRFFNTPAGKRQAVAAKHGLAQQHLNVAAVKRTQIPVPSLEEQTEIDAAMETVQRKLALIEARKNALTSLFRTLLHQLMTAQLRVSDLDVESLLSPAVPEPNAAQP